MTRLDRWSSERRIGLFIQADDPDDPVYQLHKERAKGEKKVTVTTFVRAAVEIIFEIREDQYLFHFVIPTFAPKTFELVTQANFEMFGFESEDEVKELLAWALVEEVPVYPKDPPAETELARIHRNLLENGLEVEDSEGGRARYKLSRAMDIDFESSGLLESTSSFDFLTPAELTEAISPNRAQQIL